MPPPPPSGVRPTRQTLLNIVLAAIGGALLVVTVRRVGWSEVQAGLNQVGWWFAAVVSLGGIRFMARARAWMSCVAALESHSPQSGHPSPGAVLRTRDFLAAVLAGDALGNLTPLGLLASEPAKVLMMRVRLSTTRAITSVAVENAFYIASVVAMLAAGAIVFLGRSSLPDNLRVAGQAILAGSLVVMAAAARNASRFVQ